MNDTTNESLSETNPTDNQIQSNITETDSQMQTNITETNYTSQALQPTMPTKKSKKKLFILGGIATALIAAAALVFFLFFNSDPMTKEEKVVNNTMEAITSFFTASTKKGDTIETIYKLDELSDKSSSSNVDSTMSFEVVSAMDETIPAGLKLTVDGQSDITQGKLKSNITLAFDSETSFDIGMYSDKDSFNLKIPSVMEDTMYFAKKDLYENFSNSSLEALMQTGLDESFFDTLINSMNVTSADSEETAEILKSFEAFSLVFNKNLDSLKKDIKVENIGKEKSPINSKEKCDVYEVSIPVDSITDLVISTVEEAYDNPAFSELFNTMALNSLTVYDIETTDDFDKEEYLNQNKESLITAIKMYMVALGDDITIKSYINEDSEEIEKIAFDKTISLSGMSADFNVEMLFKEDTSSIELTSTVDGITDVALIERTFKNNDSSYSLDMNMSLTSEENTTKINFAHSFDKSNGNIDFSLNFDDSMVLSLKGNLASDKPGNDISINLSDISMKAEGIDIFTMKMEMKVNLSKDALDIKPFEGETVDVLSLTEAELTQIMIAMASDPNSLYNLMAAFVPEDLESEQDWDDEDLDDSDMDTEDVPDSWVDEDDPSVDEWADEDALPDTTGTDMDLDLEDLLADVQLEDLSQEEINVIITSLEELFTKEELQPLYDLIQE